MGPLQPSREYGLRWQLPEKGLGGAREWEKVWPRVTVIRGQGSVLHTGSSLGRALAPGVTGVSPVVRTNPSEVLFCACSEAETQY